MSKELKDYCLVMYQGTQTDLKGNTTAKEPGIMVKGYSMLDVEQMVQKRKWKGKLVQIIPIIRPDTSQFDFITNVVDNVISIGGKK